MLSITKRFEFETAHFLPDYKGKCALIHGHSFKLEIEISKCPSSYKNYSSFIMDFGDLKKIVNECIIEQLDHKFLNDMFEIPTCETLVLWIQKKLFLIFQEGLERIRLYETSNSYAEWKKK